MGVFARQIRRMLPLRWQPPARYAYERAMGMLEREMPLAVAALKPGDTVVDVGANVGIYTYAFSRTGARVVAFEPQAEWARVLGAFASAHRRVSIHQVALGASSGTATLVTPIQGDQLRPGYASLSNDTAPGHKESVNVATLDSFELENVSLMKIDVEGGELDVIAGAVETIRRWRPLLLVEIEQRHHTEDIALVFARFAALGYSALFLAADGTLQPLSRFDLDRHQRLPLADPAAGPYINNFLFQPASGERKW